MLTSLDFSSQALPFADANDAVSPDTSAWGLTHAMHLLRLTVADASLRALEDAQLIDHANPDHWAALGRARGYHEAASLLRGWTHPDTHDDVLAQFAARLNKLEGLPTAQTKDQHPALAEAYQHARIWSLNWALTQARELCAPVYVHG